MAAVTVGALEEDFSDDSLDGYSSDDTVGALEEDFSDDSLDGYSSDDSLDASLDGYSSETFYDCNLSWAEDDRDINTSILKHIQNKHANSKQGLKHCEQCAPEVEEPHFVVRVLQGWLVEQPTTDSEETMNPAVWSRLPEELLARCVAMLPMDSRCRFSVVAKGWCSLLRSSEFKQLCSDVRPVSVAPICALECYPGRFGRCKPRPTDVSYLSQPMEVRRLELPRSLPDKFKQFHPSCCNVQDGLVFVYKRGKMCHEIQDRAVDMCVMNPVTQHWLELPLKFSVTEYDHFVHKRAQVRSLSSGQFQVTIVCSSLGMPRVSMFSSQNSTWTMVNLGGRSVQYLWPGGGPDYLEEDVPNWPQYAACNGLLILAEKAHQSNSFSFQVYNLDDGKLVRQLDRDSYPKVVRKILEHGGRLFLVGSENVRPVKYGIWELDFSSFLWSQLSALPEQFLWEEPSLHVDRYLDPTWYLEDAVFAGPKLCLKIFDRGQLCSTDHFVAYDVEQDTWSTVSRGMVQHRLASQFDLFSPSFQ